MANRPQPPVPTPRPDPQPGRAAQARNFGIGMILLGLAALVLPLLGLQLKVLAKLGAAAPIAGGILLLIGIFALVASRSAKAADRTTNLTKGMLYGVIGLLGACMLLVVVMVVLVVTGWGDRLFGRGNGNAAGFKLGIELAALPDAEFKARAVQDLESPDPIVRAAVLVELLARVPAKPDADITRVVIGRLQANDPTRTPQEQSQLFTQLNLRGTPDAVPVLEQMVRDGTDWQKSGAELTLRLIRSRHELAQASAKVASADEPPAARVVPADPPAQQLSPLAPEPSPDKPPTAKPLKAKPPAKPPQKTPASQTGQTPGQQALALAKAELASRAPNGEADVLADVLTGLAQAPAAQPSKEVTAFLLPYIKRKEKPVRLAVVQALGAWGTPPVVRALDILAKSKDEQIHSAALAAAQQVRAQPGFVEPTPAKKKPADQADPAP